MGDDVGSKFIAELRRPFKVIFICCCPPTSLVV